MTFTTPVVIGLEIHIEMNTKSKLFCPCPRTGSEEPNMRTCPVCLGHPGTRPMTNAAAITAATKLCLATGCTIAPTVIFSRKSYFYPDMGKNYQITQFEEPIGANGNILLSDKRRIGIERIHIEEDPASITYPQDMQTSTYALLDYNRAGNPLVELVTEPTLQSPQDARDFLTQLQSIITYLGIFDADTCIIKADANVSIKESGYTRIEIKNIGGFKDVERALTAEITRQRAYVRAGKTITQETRGYNTASKLTFSMRTKETEADYGYITEPDIPRIDMEDARIDELRKALPELAHARAERFHTQYGVPEGDAYVLALERELAELYERLATNVDPLLAARWLRRELLRVLNYHKLRIKDMPITDEELTEVLQLVQERMISETTAQRLLERLCEERFSPRTYVKEHRLEQVTDDTELRQVAKRVIDEHAEAVNDYRTGEEKAFHYLVGQIMGATGGRADPELVNRILRELLE